MRLLTKSHPLLQLAITLVVACAGHLPKTEPPGVDDSLATTTNDTPAAAPMAHDSVLPGMASGGSNALPLPPQPSGGGGGTDGR